MKKVSFAIPFLLIPLVSCVNNKGSSAIVEEQKYTATFLLNCKAEDIELGSGYITAYWVTIILFVGNIVDLKNNLYENHEEQFRAN